MARRRRGFSARRGPKNQIWTVIVIEDVAVANTAVDSIIVASSDWSRGGSFEKATVLRTRRWLSISTSPTQTVKAGFFAAIYAVDEDNTAVAAHLPALYSDEDVLWTGGFMIPAGNATAVERPAAFNFDIDVKSMRKINNGQELRLATVVGASGLTTRMSGVIRALVRIGGN